MASYITNYCKAAIAGKAPAIDLDSDTLKIVLLKTLAGDTVDLDFIGDFTGAGCVEANPTNYTGGFGGGGRKTATVAITSSDANDRAEITIGSLTWTALGGASNNTIVAALLVKEITNDAASPVIAVFDLTDTPTNGGDFTLTWASNLALTLT